MRIVYATIVVLAGGAWLGAMLLTAASVSYFFMTDRELAVQFGPRMFRVFETFQGIVATLTLAAAILWRLSLCSTAKRWMTRLLIAAAVGAVFSTAVVTPRINHMWNTGQSRTPEFRKWHGVSQMVNLLQLLSLSVGLGFVPAGIIADARRGTSKATAAG